VADGIGEKPLHTQLAAKQVAARNVGPVSVHAVVRAVSADGHT
jgi:hypothetical protein